MNFPEKSARFIAFLGGFLLLALTGCDDMPHYFSGNEVPPDVMAQPRVVASPTPEQQADKTYQRLADTPSKPKTFTPQPIIDATRQEMEGLSAEGQVVHDKYAPNFAPSTDKGSNP